MTAPQNILVVGASGFIGTALCAHLKTVWPHAKLHALARAGSDVPSYVQKHITDNWSLDAISDVTKGHVFGVIFNLAAYGVSPNHRNFAAMQAVNVILPSTLVQFAHQHGASVIHAGSSAEYSKAADLYLDETASALNTSALYGASKSAGAMMAIACAQPLNVTFMNLRLFNVFGAGEAPHRLFPSLIKAAQTGQSTALSDGLQLRDFIHIADVCRAFELAAIASKEISSSSAPRQYVLNICSGIPVSVRDFALSVFGALAADPSLLKFGVIERRPDDLVRVVGCPDRAAADIGFRIKKNLQATLSHALTTRMDAA